MDFQICFTLFLSLATPTRSQMLSQNPSFALGKLNQRLTGVADGVATLKVRKGAFDGLNSGSGAFGKVK